MLSTTPAAAHLGLMRWARVSFGLGLSLWTSASVARADATFEVSYSDAEGIGFNDSTPAEAVGGNAGRTLGEQRRIAFESALDTWGAAIDSVVPVVVDARFRDLGCDLTLASTQPVFVFARDAMFPSALIDKVSGRNVRPGSTDIQIRFNSARLPGSCVDSDEFYYGLDDANVAYPFVAVALHELAHGLGFADSLTPGANWQGMAPDVFSTHVFDRAQGKYLSAMNPEERRDALQSVRQLVFDGEETNAAAAAILLEGTPTLAVTPAIEGFTGIVSEANFGVRAVDQSVSAELVVDDRTLCGAAPFVDPSGRVLLSSNPCPISYATKAEAAGAVAVLFRALGPEGATSPPVPYAVASPPPLEIIVLTISADDADRLALSVAEQTVTVDISANPEQLLGADPEGRVYLSATRPAILEHMSHWDALVSPGLLMEPVVARDRDPSVPVLDITLAVLRDLGWTECGDGLVSGLEACDDAEGNSATEPGACRPWCQFSECGDEVVDSAEVCDPGARSFEAVGRCRLDCSGTCGDGMVNGDEECDPGGALPSLESDTCRDDCILRCGDGILDTNEECDDGDVNSDSEPDGCRKDCSRAHCGDGTVDSNEECDDGKPTETCGAGCRELVEDAAAGCDGGACDGGTDGGPSNPTEPEREEAPGCGCRMVRKSEPDSRALAGLGILAVAWSRCGRRSVRQRNFPATSGRSSRLHMRLIAST